VTQVLAPHARDSQSVAQVQRVTSQCQLRDVGSLKWPKHVPQITKRAANWTLARRPLWQGPLLQVRRTRVVTVTARTVPETPSRILNESSGKAAPLHRLVTLLQSPEPTRQLAGAAKPHNKDIQPRLHQNDANCDNTRQQSNMSAGCGGTELSTRVDGDPFKCLSLPAPAYAQRNTTYSLRHRPCHCHNTSTSASLPLLTSTEECSWHGNSGKHAYSARHRPRE